MVFLGAGSNEICKKKKKNVFPVSLISTSFVFDIPEGDPAAKSSPENDASVQPGQT